MSQKAAEMSRASGPGEKRESRRILSGGLSGHQMLLVSDMRRRRTFRDEDQVEVVDDPVDYSEFS